MQFGLLILVEVDIVIQCHNYLEANRMHIDKNYILIAWSSGEASPTIYSCYVNFLSVKTISKELNNDIIILTIEIYIAGVKNRAGFATGLVLNICCNNCNEARKVKTQFSHG